MLRGKVKTVVLYLEDWQKRMVKDFLKVDCDTYEVEIKPSVQMKYGIPTHEKHKRMYFTDWQIREMRDETGMACEFIELTEESQSGFRYMPPTP